MSTVPPPSIADRLATRHRRPGPSPRTVLAVLVVGLAGAFIEGHSIARIAKAPLWTLGIVGGIWLVFPALFAVAGWTIRARLADTSAPVVGVVSYLAALLAVGGATLTVQAQQDSSFGTAGRIALIIALGCAVLAGLGYGRRYLHSRGQASVRRVGQHVYGTMIDDGLAEFRPGPNLKIATVTVRFVDLQGVKRWLQCSAVQSPGQPLGVGDTVSVWFDPVTPQDLSRITVEADNGLSRIVRVHR